MSGAAVVRKGEWRNIDDALVAIDFSMNLFAATLWVRQVLYKDQQGLEESGAQAALRWLFLLFPP